MSQIAELRWNVGGREVVVGQIEFPEMMELEKGAIGLNNSTKFGTIEIETNLMACEWMTSYSIPFTTIIFLIPWFGLCPCKTLGVRAIKKWGRWCINGERISKTKQGMMVMLMTKWMKNWKTIELYSLYEDKLEAQIFPKAFFWEFPRNSHTRRNVFVLFLFYIFLNLRGGCRMQKAQTKVWMKKELQLINIYTKYIASKGGFRGKFLVILVYELKTQTSSVTKRIRHELLVWNAFGLTKSRDNFLTTYMFGLGPINWKKQPLRLHHVCPLRKRKIYRTWWLKHISR